MRQIPGAAGTVRSLGTGRGENRRNMVLASFRAGDGWFVLQVVREHQFERLAAMVGRPEWLSDERFATRAGWSDHLDDVIRPAIEKWASAKSRLDACAELGQAGIAAGPCFRAEEVVHDPHLEAHHMVVEHPRFDGVDSPVLVPGNPVKLSRVAEGPETRVPWLGEHTDDVLRAEAGLTENDVAALRADGVV